MTQVEKKTHFIDKDKLVTSAYADVHFDEAINEYKNNINNESVPQKQKENESQWVSPSDILIGKSKLNLPYTFNILKSKIHQSILDMGENVLKKSNAQFLADIQIFFDDNVAAWKYILELEKVRIKKEVEKSYGEILRVKCNILQAECEKFYTKHLQNLETHVKDEVAEVIRSLRESMFHELSEQIATKLKLEKQKLNKTFFGMFLAKVRELNQYYGLLLKYEKNKHNEIKYRALNESKESIIFLLRQLEMENYTKTMYILCTDRKKCKVKQFKLKQYLASVEQEFLNTLKEKQQELSIEEDKYKSFVEIHKCWEEKITKIFQLFLKFIGFSLTLIPQQATFLLDFQKLMTLQVNEFFKAPLSAHSVFVEDDNVTSFLKSPEKVTSCKKQTFTIEGKTSASLNSRGTSDIDLDYFRVQKKYTYAKCEKFEDVKKLLESKQCQCHSRSFYCRSDRGSQDSTPSSYTSKRNVSERSFTIESIYATKTFPKETKFESFQGNKIGLADYAQQEFDPSELLDVPEYIEFDDEKYEEVKCYLRSPSNVALRSEILNVNQCVNESVSTVNKAKVSTACQYDLVQQSSDCTCSNDKPKVKSAEEISTLRKNSLVRLLQDNPKLLDNFFNGDYDFIK